MMKKSLQAIFLSLSAGASLLAAEWISVPDAPVFDGIVQESAEALDRAADGTSWFASTFTNGSEIVSARWTVAGLGVFEVFVNGARVGDDFLKPGYTHWANGQYQEDKNNRVWIVRDSWEGEWQGAYFGYQRRTDVFVLPIDCEHSRDARQETMTLYRRSGRFLGLGFYHPGIYDDWQSWQGGKIIYTASIVLFKETKPEGFSLVDI